MRLTGIFLAVVVIGLAIAWIASPGDAGIAEIGETAPDFTVELIDGGTFTLSDARGAPVVLNLWASWCSPCREEIPAISAFADSNPDVAVIGVAVEDLEQASREFAAEIGAGYPLALDTDNVADTYPYLGLPATYIIDENGRVAEFVNGIVNEEVLAELVPRV